MKFEYFLLALVITLIQSVIVYRTQHVTISIFARRRAAAQFAHKKLQLVAAIADNQNADNHRAGRS